MIIVNENRRREMAEQIQSMAVASRGDQKSIDALVKKLTD
jgi:hypothetical protein